MDTELKKIYSQINNGDEFIATCKRLGMDKTTLYGVIEALKLENVDIDLYEDKGYFYFKKKTHKKRTISVKPEMDDLEEIKLCVISDTHMGCTMQQLTLINKVYQEAYDRGIDIVLHCGDMVDGDYRNKRPAWPYQEFAQGFDQQKRNVIEFYPIVIGMQTFFICGSHDETHFLNGGANIGRDIAEARPDMHYLGMDKAVFKAGKNRNVDILMVHPGGGVSKSLSYKPQETINKMASGSKPKILLEGHYHKSYFMQDRNIYTLLVPCLVGLSPFMRRMDLENVMGAYFLTIYVNKKGEIEYFIPEEMRFDPDEEIKDDYKTAKQLVITKPKKKEEIKETNYFSNAA